MRGWWLLALSVLALYSHLLLDFLNNYGVRVLAPLDWRWFYGDALFILDPWLWLTLGIGVWVARRTRAPQPARIALGVAAGYVAVMLASAAIAREAVVREWRASRGYDPSALMVGPVPVSPFSHQVIIDAGTHYETGTYRFSSPRLRLDAARIPKNEHPPEVAAARMVPAIRGFLVWSRFPFWEVRRTEAGTLVTVQDIRFSVGGVRFSASAMVCRSGWSSISCDLSQNSATGVFSRGRRRSRDVGHGRATNSTTGTGSKAGARIVLTAPLTETIDHAGYFIQMSMASLPMWLEGIINRKYPHWRDLEYNAGRDGALHAGRRPRARDVAAAPVPGVRHRLLLPGGSRQVHRPRDTGGGCLDACIRAVNLSRSAG